MKATTDYGRFKTILPYASEIFGVYQPMIGWKSKRQLQKAAPGIDALPIGKWLEEYDPDIDVEFSDSIPILGRPLAPATARHGHPVPQNDSLLLASIAGTLRETSRPQTLEEWVPILLDTGVEQRLRDDVFPAWSEAVTEDLHRVHAAFQQLPHETNEQAQARLERELTAVEDRAKARLAEETVIAKVIFDLFDHLDTTGLDRIFYGANHLAKHPGIDDLRTIAELRNAAFEDPFLLFRPQQDIQDVSLSPLGIVHLFRQFFFEFDTFLGTPASHVWLSPGSSVELIETSTRKTTTERTVETAYETVVKTERSTTEQDDVSEAIKQENRDDTKIGFSTTATQSWGTGSATATGSLNLDSTQMTAREDTHKRMRQQTEKLSTEIRQSYKSTFRTVTEVTDVSSKRYLLANTTPHLINYELRRKMRQVGVQVQDIGTYLCWQAYVDEPGATLGLANLVHIAQPTDLVPQPNVNEIPLPPSPITKGFELPVVWDFKDRKRNHFDPPYIPLGTLTLPFQVDPGYEIVRPPQDRVAIHQRSGHGEDFSGVWAFAGTLVGNDRIEIGVVAGPKGLDWDERVDFVVNGELTLQLTAAKRQEIETANAKIVSDRLAATRAQQRASEEAFHKAAKERIEQAAAIEPRKFEELREEERTVVYRALIRELMTDQFYTLPAGEDNDEIRHVLSELLNSIFDIDKMLYFVAPEWWKPRTHYSQFLGKSPGKSPGLGKAKPSHGALGNDLVVNWSNSEVRPDNYYITNTSEPAKLGSSLGWLLQLDGDNHRNAFLNAPWVKTVIPIRPGKEQIAINWLTQVNVEGADGLSNNYAAPDSELEQIRDGLLAEDPNDPVADHPTIGDAIRYLCLQVARKHAESLRVRKFPMGIDIHDDDQVSATPVDKVYEHGFYPLQGGFRIDPLDPDPNNPEPNFQVFDQWVEILPTDQIVPVEVAYDPITGRQIPVPPRTEPDPGPNG
jgi:hypothetical protein